MPTNFEKAVFFNECAGNTRGTGCEWKTADRQLSLIEEEFHELCESVAAGNYAGVRDAIADVLVTTYGLAHRLGIDADKDFDEVHQSNMSKFCKDPNELNATIEKYTKLGIIVAHRGDFPQVCVYSAGDQSDVNGKSYPKGKILKCAAFKEPNFDEDY